MHRQFTSPIIFTMEKCTRIFNSSTDEQREHTQCCNDKLQLIHFKKSFNMIQISFSVMTVAVVKITLAINKNRRS